MHCPHCKAKNTKKITRLTVLGYHQYRCCDCGRQYNERTGTKLVDVYLRDVRDQAAAEAFFEQAQNTTGIAPEQITTDKEKALYPAIKCLRQPNQAS